MQSDRFTLHHPYLPFYPNLSDITAHYPDEFYNPAITRMYRLKDKMEGRDDAE